MECDHTTTKYDDNELLNKNNSDLDIDDIITDDSRKIRLRTTKLGKISKISNSVGEITANSREFHALDRKNRLSTKPSETQTICDQKQHKKPNKPSTNGKYYDSVSKQSRNPLFWTLKWTRNIHLSKNTKVKCHCRSRTSKELKCINPWHYDFN
jgi:hypothetical protein